MEKPNVPVEELGLPPRVYHCLKSAGLHTVESILHATAAELLGIRNFGMRSMNILRRTLQRRGYLWNPERSPDPETSAERRTAVLGMNIEQVGFSDDLVERLHLAQIEQVGELATRPPETLLRFPQIGRRRIKIIRSVLNDLGLDLGMDLVRTSSGEWLDRLEDARRRLAEMLRDPADLYLFSKEYGIGEKPLGSFFRGAPLSRFLTLKLRRLLAGEIDLARPFDRRALRIYQKYMEVESVYRQAGGLKKAAAQLRMSHEHVRTMLRRGSALKLFAYRPRP